MLVAKIESASGSSSSSSSSSFFGLAGGSGAKSQVVGCVGCQTKCYMKFTEEEVPVAQFDEEGDSQFLRPVMADLAVASEYRGRGVAKALLAALEEIVRGWGFDELGLCVEFSNLQAQAAYGRLGYRLAALRLGVPTAYLDTQDGSSKLELRTTTAFTLRKSLKQFPFSAIENFDWGFYVFLPAVLYVAVTTWVPAGSIASWVSTELPLLLPAQLDGLLPPLLDALPLPLP